MKKVYAVMVTIIIFCLYALTDQPAWIYGAEPRIEDQGNSAMCGVYAACSGIEYQMRLDGMKVPENGFSEQWLWNKCREIDNDESGVRLETALKIASEFGLCPVGGDPIKYDISYNLVSKKDYQETLSAGAIIIVSTEYQKKNWEDGILTYDYKEPISGLHASYLVGYKDGYYEGVNSWGKDWGLRGRYKMDEEFLTCSVLGGYTVKIRELKE